MMRGPGLAWVPPVTQTSCTCLEPVEALIDPQRDFSLEKILFGHVLIFTLLRFVSFAVLEMNIVNMTFSKQLDQFVTRRLRFCVCA